MINWRGCFASSLCLALILQIIVLANAAQVEAKSEWTGTIEEEYRRSSNLALYPGSHYKGHAEFTFTVDGATIKGSGTGWEENVTYFDNGSVCGQGRADNITFRVAGIFDHKTGKASISLKDFNPDEYVSSCFDVEKYPFGGFRSFQIDLKDGASSRPYEADAQVSGTFELVIHGTAPSIECPALTITPTMPPASNPRITALPTDNVSYRMQVAWEGRVPAKVVFNVEGGGENVSPSFTFNPASMQTSPISVLMDVATNQAEDGEYTFAVQAGILDEDVGDWCVSNFANLTLVVASETGNVVFTKRTGDVEITPGPGDDDRAVTVKTGDDGAATFTVPIDEESSTTADVGSNTRFTFDRLAQLIEKAQDEESGYRLSEREEDEQFAYELWASEEEGLVKTILEKVEKLSDSIRDFVNNSALGRDVIVESHDVLTCLIAPTDPTVADLCSQKSLIYMQKGELHVVDVSERSKMVDRINTEPAILTDNSLIIPTDTEFAIQVQQSATSIVTTVTLLEGSAIVVDLVSENMELVNAGQKYTTETFLEEGRPVSTDNLESVSKDSVPHWWKIQTGDYATAKDIDTKEGVKPVDRTSVFSVHDSGVWIWIEFLNVPSQEEHLVDFKWYAPDGSLYDTGDYTMIEAPSIEYWDSYGPFDLMGIDGFEASEKTGRWHTDVYYDGDFVRQIPFYIAKNTLVKDQSVTYKLAADVRSSNTEIQTALENSLVQGLVGGFSGAENIERIDDIEWVKATVLDASAEGELRDTLKLKGKGSIDGEPRSLSSAFLSSFIPTIGIDEELTIPANLGGGSELMPSQLVFDKMVNLNIAGSNIKAFQFSGSKKLVEGDASSDFTITTRYEKYTGMLVDGLISGRIMSAEIGNLELDFGVKATEMSIPISLTIASIQSEIQQNQAVSVSGTTSPAVNEGQVVITYERNDSGDPPIKRTVTIADGVFSDSYNMEKDGTYTVTAEYLGSGAFLSSTADAKTLTVTPSGCLIATAAFGSELTPQVQFLRNFRDSHILSTAAGSSFMNAFNTWYYSFSPSVADYEREQPWLQTTVRTAIYPLLGILTISEKAYSSMPGEYGAVTAGIVASSMIGAVYFWPAAFVVQRFNRFNKKMVNALTIVLTGLAVGAATISMLLAEPAALTAATSILVLTVVTISALFSAQLIGYVINRAARKN